MTFLRKVTERFRFLGVMVRHLGADQVGGVVARYVVSVPEQTCWEQGPIRELFQRSPGVLYYYFRSCAVTCEILVLKVAQKLRLQLLFVFFILLNTHSIMSKKQDFKNCASKN